MATATATPTVTSTSFTNSAIQVGGTIVVTGDPATYLAGGLTLDFTKGWPAGQSLPASAPPRNVEIRSAKANGTSLFLYKYNPGTTAANGKLQIFDQDAVDENPLDEFDTGTAVVVGISGDTIQFNASFAKLQ